MMKWIMELLAELDEKAKLAAQFEAHIAQRALVYG